MDNLDRAIINRLQDGLPVTETPYAETAMALGITEKELLLRIERLLEENILSRFGPMYNAEEMGGRFVLCAMEVPRARFDDITGIVNRFPEVAHNYERNHRLNMWFVLATETVRQLDCTVDAIERKTGLKVYQMPKLEEFYVGLRLAI